MGGFTVIRLKDVSQENIDKQNAKLIAYGVNKKYSFYSENNVRKEYQYFVAGEGHFPENLFPKHKIKSYEDFKVYWHPDNVGEVFVPYFGTLTLDCYFGRMSVRAMKKLGSYITNNVLEIEAMYGSVSTFMERGMTRLEKKIVSESNIKLL
jgi:hypothetical protein